MARRYSLPSAFYTIKRVTRVQVMVVGELSRNFKGEYTIGPASSPSFASVCGTYAPDVFLKQSYINIVY
jgi:hypothetical protein